MIIRYNTRDGNGADIVKDVEIKEFPPETASFVCPVCGKVCSSGIRVKKIVSANFTDWSYLGEYICEDCAKLFSLYFYSYEVSPRGIELFNAREAPAKILGEHIPPFRLIVTKSRKKHLFFKSALNYDAEHFAINLEEETIPTSRARMRELFDFAECLITLGASKTAMADGEIAFPVIQEVGFGALKKLQTELERSREIQIPLFCGQKRGITDKEAIECIIDLTRTT
jgi:ribosomal protein L17